MALTISAAQCVLCFCGTQLRNVVVFQGERGHWRFLNRRMRCSYFLPSKLSKMCSRLKHKFAEKLLMEIEQQGSRNSSKLHNKVSFLMDYDLPDLIGNERVEKKSEMNFKGEVDELDISLVCKRFPSIILGSASQVDLYDGSTSNPEMSSILATVDLEQYFSDSSEARWVQNTLSEAWPSMYANHSSVKSSSLREEDSYTCPLSPHSMSSIYEETLDHQVTKEDCHEKVRLQSQMKITSNELFLDKSITCVPGLNKRNCRQLENRGFHTLRKLLHHFPRTYADLQNAQSQITDGQYLIFVGKILSSRGVRASFSFSFLEVVVECQVVDSESAFQHVTGNVIDKGKETIYLHLKKFFRGTRFTCKPFLKCLAEKYQEGDLACVSGKVIICLTETNHVKEAAVSNSFLHESARLG